MLDQGQYTGSLGSLLHSFNKNCSTVKLSITKVVMNVDDVKDKLYQYIHITCGSKLEMLPVLKHALKYTLNVNP